MESGRRGIKHYTAVLLTFAMLLGQAVPAAAYTDAAGSITELNASSDEQGVLVQEADALEDIGEPDTESQISSSLEDEPDSGLVSFDGLKVSSDEVSEDIEEPEENLRDDVITGGYSEDRAEPDQAGSMYDFDASLIDVSGNKYPGVYKVTPTKTSSRKVIGIPSISNETLKNNPTTESPAIIMGAAVSYETRHYTKEKGIYFEPVDGKTVPAPYSYFRYDFIEEPNTNGTGVHRKITGYDGTYIIIRVDVSELIKDAPEGSYLHVKQSNNKAIMVKIGQDVAEGMGAFSDAMGTRTGAYLISDNKLVKRDESGDFTEGSYIDVVLLSSGTLVQGADTGSAMEDPKSPLADFPLNFYIDQVGDYDPNIEWNELLGTAVDKTTGKEVVLTQEEINAKITTKDKMLNKYYDDNKAKTSSESQYTVKGSDIELEIMVESKEGAETESKKTEYWSMRKGMEYQAYDNHALKLMCEAPLLHQINVSGNSRKVILDVNSFDIQLANHEETKEAAITVDGATLTVMDTSNTTGAELAVGNNASMVIRNNGRLIIDETAQLEVEYDSASVSAGEVPTQKELNNGVLTVTSGGILQNNGVITVEGKEGKPQDAQDAQGVVRDYRNAILTIDEGGTLENHGCLLVNGEFYNLGTVKNDGNYNDVITSDDPDKGLFTYHKGIQLSWKDDITQGHTNAGEFYNGINDGNTKHNENAVVENTGDFVMVPGYLENYAKLLNKGNIYMCAVDEVVIPIAAYADQPLVTEKRINLGYDEYSFILNNTYGDGYTYSNVPALISNSGKIAPAKVEVVSNGRTGTLTPDVSDYPEDLNINGSGNVENSGTIGINSVYTYGKVTISGNGRIDRVILCQVDGVSGNCIDTSSTKGSKIYNGVKTQNGAADIWDYAGETTLKVSEDTWRQEADPGQKVTWSLTADNDNTGKNILCSVEIFRMNPFEFIETKDVYANSATAVTSPAMPDISGNSVYLFIAEGTEPKTDEEKKLATVKVHGTGFIRPTAMQGPGENKALVYNGKEQALVTPGSIRGGQVLYRMSENERFSTEVPVAKDAGTYTVNYKAVDLEGNDIAGLSENITVTIAKKDVYIAADDKIRRKGQAEEALTYVAHGVVSGDNLEIAVTREGPDMSGSYILKPTYTNDNNYKVNAYNGIYKVLDTEVDISADVQAAMVAFDNVAHSLSANITYKPVVSDNKAAVYYSTTEELNSSNYNTAGTLQASYGGMGVQIIYYYITTPEGVGVGGSKPVVVTKADQAVPDKLSGTASLIGMGGTLSGLVPYNYDHISMEYRRADAEDYTRAISDEAVVSAGNYLVRWAGDEHFNPSYDTIVPVSENKVVNVSFESNGGSKVDGVTGLIFGDVLEKPADPVRKGYDFAGWFIDDMLTSKADLPGIIVNDTAEAILYAKWDKKIPGTTDSDYEELSKDIDEKSLSVNVIKRPDGTVSKNIITVSDKEISNTDINDGKETINSSLWIGGLKASYSYTGEAIKPQIHVYDGVKMLTEKTDYTLSYKNNKNVGNVGDKKNGKSIAPEITVSFKGNYQGAEKRYIEFNIVPAMLGSVIDVHDVSVAALNNNKEQKPQPLIVWKDTGKKINPKFFKITYDGSDSVTGPKTYSAQIKYNDPNFAGTASCNVIVTNDKDKLMSKASVRIPAYTYTGEAIIPAYKDITVKIGNQILNPNEDYVIDRVYNNVVPGTATVILKALDSNTKGYTGTQTATFRINNGRELKKDGGFRIEYDEAVPYAKSGAKPSVKVYDGETLLKEKVDYTVSYSKNNKLTEDKKTAVMTVKGKGKYKGSVVCMYDVVKQNLNYLTVTADDQFVTKEKYKAPKITITESDGKKLTKKDYLVGEPECSVSGNTTITVWITGTGTYEGKRSVTFRLMDKSADIGKARLNSKITDQLYSGDPVILNGNDFAGKLSLGGKNLEYGRDFEVVEGSYVNNVKKGTAKVTVRGINGFGGVKTLTFKIAAKQPKYQGVLIDGKWRQ